MWTIFGIPAVIWFMFFMFFWIFQSIIILTIVYIARVVKLKWREIWKKK